jgi:hypothetical protein
MADAYGFSYDVFPENLLEKQLGGHVMKIDAYINVGTGTGGTFGSNNNGGEKAYSAMLFIPGGGAAGSSNMAYEDTHEWVDIKLTQPITSTILGSSGNILAGLTSRRAIIPGLQVLYRTTNLRRFVYSFLFAPTSQTESASMYNIVKNLRRYSHPDVDSATNGLFFLAPAEWEISFWFNGEENKSIPRIKRCSMQRVIVDYSSQGEWSSFYNGHPISCMMTLEFEELEIITQQYVLDGF